MCSTLSLEKALHQNEMPVYKKQNVLKYVWCIIMNLSASPSPEDASGKLLQQFPHDL